MVIHIKDILKILLFSPFALDRVLVKFLYSSLVNLVLITVFLLAIHLGSVAFRFLDIAHFYGLDYSIKLNYNAIISLDDVNMYI